MNWQNVNSVEVSVPVGNSDHTPYVVGLTTFVVSGGTIYLLVAIFRKDLRAHPHQDWNNNFIQVTTFIPMHCISSHLSNQHNINFVIPKNLWLVIKLCQIKSFRQLEKSNEYYGEMLLLKSSILTNIPLLNSMISACTKHFRL